MEKNNKPYKIEEIQKMFSQKGYIMVSNKYKNKNTRLKFICEKHKEYGIQEVSFASFHRNKNNCKYCQSAENKKLWHKKRNFKPISDEEFKIKHFEKYKTKVFLTVGDEYELVDIYRKDKKSHLILKHSLCGELYDVSQYLFFKNHCRCQNKECLIKRKREQHLKTTNQFKEEVFNLVGNEYMVCGEYTGKDNKILFLHNECHKYFEKSPHNFLAGQRCIHCYSPTKGESRIINYLETHNIIFEFQKSFNGLLGTRNGLLSYDFYIESLNLLIEYQGEYHDGSTSNIDEKQFERQKEHDRRKKDYAKIHNINLLEVWYWDYENIEKILDARITELKENL